MIITLCLIKPFPLRFPVFVWSQSDDDQLPRRLIRPELCVFLLTGLSQQGSAGQGRRLVRWMAGGWDRRHGKALEWVRVGVRVGWAVGRQVAGVAGLLLSGGGAVVAPLGVDHDLRWAGGLRGGGGWREGL